MLLMVPAVAVNVLDVDPAVTATEAGTVSNPLLLESATVAPPAGAACESVTVQVDVAPLPRLLGLHETEVTVVLAASERLIC